MDNTKLKIVRSFINLCMSKSPFEITINEIIDLSGISKGTFYNNFNSKEGIIKYLFKFIDSTILQDFKLMTNNYSNEENKAAEVVDFFANSSLNDLYENREIIKGISLSPYISGFWILHLKKRYLHALKELFPKASDFNLTVMIYYVIGVTHTWICSPLPKTPNEFKQQFKDLMNTKAIDLINNSK